MRAEATAELTREIADAGRGVVRLARHDAKWAEPLDLSATGFLRSFSSHWLREAPVWAGLKRMFSRALASAGMTLVAGLPTSTVVSSRFDGGKAG